MAVSSIGIGSGLDVQSIISKLVSLEQRPLAGLQQKAEGIQTQVSTYGKIKSLTSALADAASKLTLDSGWNALGIKSSKESAVKVSVSGQAQAGTFDIGVSQLAQAHTLGSNRFAQDHKMTDGGQLTLTPAASGASPIQIDYAANDTLQDIAGKINDKASGLVASVMRDASGQEQLMLRARETGAQAAFTLTDSANQLTFTQSQAGKDAEITINGIAQSSATNAFENVLPGLKIEVSEVTTGPARVDVTNDKEATRKNIQTFIDAYNELNTLLKESTGYDAETKKSGVLQGDSGTVGLQNALRSLTMGTAGNATGALQRLADIGIEVQRGGELRITKPDKLDAALDNPEAIKSLFAAKASSDGTGGGIAVNFKEFTNKLLAFDGTLNNKTDALELRIKANQKEQDKVLQRASTLESRLAQQYTALDAKMASISALSSYMTQQVAMWNNTKNN